MHNEASKHKLQTADLLSGGFVVVSRQTDPNVVELTKDSVIVEQNEPVNASASIAPQAITLRPEIRPDVRPAAPREGQSENEFLFEATDPSVRAAAPRQSSGARPIDITTLSQTGKMKYVAPQPAVSSASLIQEMEATRPNKTLLIAMGAVFALGAVVLTVVYLI